MMKLRLLSIFASVVLLFFVFSPPAFAVATQCEIHKGNEWRCAKDNFRSDNILINNITDKHVSFAVGQWTSRCGKKGTEYYRDKVSLYPGATTSIPFPEAKPGECKELFVFNCSPDSCTKIVGPRSAP
jgi:hypothetical protein